MSIDIKIQQLKQTLAQLNQHHYADNFESYVFQEEYSAWNEVLKELDKIEDSAISATTKYVAKGLGELVSAAKALSQFGQDEIKSAIDAYKKHAASYNKIADFTNYDLIKSFKSDSINKKAQIGKLWSAIPIIGYIWSFFASLKNLYSGVYEYQKLVSEAQKLNLSWKDTLYPDKLELAIKQNQEDPENLRILVKTTKYAKAFVDEGISFIFNSIDFAKDMIFLVANLLSLGTSTFIDIGLTVVFVAGELAYEADLLPKYDKILEDIRTIATNKLIQPSQQAFDYDSMSDEDKQKWFDEYINSLA